MLPNGFYRTLEDVDPTDLQIVCYGVPRSGTTLIYQLMCGIYSEGVAKTHRYCNHRVKTLVSFRDFRDVAVSLWRRSDPKNVRCKMSKADVEKFGTICQERIKELDRYFDRGGICPLRYEDFVNDPKVIFSAIEKAFGVVVDASRAANLVNKYSLEKNKEISERLGAFRQVDPGTQIHGNHVYRGEVGSWRQFVSDRNAERLEVRLRPSLGRYGYV